MHMYSLVACGWTLNTPKIRIVQKIRDDENRIRICQIISETPEIVRVVFGRNGKPAWREMISASAELCETEVCFLHIQIIDTNVWLPKMHRIPPDVRFESSVYPAKSESGKNPDLQCCAVFAE